MIHELETDRLELRQWRSIGSRFGLRSSSTTIDCPVKKLNLSVDFYEVGTVILDDNL